MVNGWDVVGLGVAYESVHMGALIALKFARRKLSAWRSANAPAATETMLLSLRVPHMKDTPVFGTHAAVDVLV